jgi:hypothetical protein
MNLADFRGMVTGLMSDPDAVGMAAIDWHINVALQSVSNLARDQWNARFETTAYLDIEADKDVYPIPDYCASISRLERLDIGASAGTVVAPVLYGRDDEGPTGAGLGYATRYTILPGGRELRLLSVPTTATTHGMRLTFYAKPVRLVTANDEPLWLPDDVHESIPYYAMMTLRGVRGVSLADDRAFSAAFELAARQLVSTFNPTNASGAPSIVDENPYYEE